MIFDCETGVFFSEGNTIQQRNYHRFKNLIIPLGLWEVILPISTPACSYCSPKWNFEKQESSYLQLLTIVNSNHHNKDDSEEIRWKKIILTTNREKNNSLKHFCFSV